MPLKGLNLTLKDQMHACMLLRMSPSHSRLGPSTLQGGRPPPNPPSHMRQREQASHTRRRLHTPQQTLWS